MSEHTPEPWELEKIEDQGDGYEAWISALHYRDPRGIASEWHALAMTFGMDGPEGNRECVSNARRIVACVNACAGMGDPAKEIAALRAQVEGKDWEINVITKLAKEWIKQEYIWRHEDSECGLCEIEEGIRMKLYNFDIAIDYALAATGKEV